MRIQIDKPLAIYELGQRANQEDALYPSDGVASASNRVFVLCDGMGGHERGEVASQTISRAIGTWLDSHTVAEAPLSDDMLLSALEYAYQQLDQKDNGEYKKMGTTLTVVVFHRGGVTAAHIGDSRIYHIRPGKGLLYISRDHSLVFELFQAGEIEYEEMATSPSKNIISKAVQPGVDNRVKPDIIHITDIQPGDYFYLCSDGMIEEMDDDDIYRLFSSNADNEYKQRILIDETSDNADNHTAWIIQVNNVIREPADSNTANEELTARCNAINIINERKMAVEKQTQQPIMRNEGDDVELVSQPAPQIPQQQVIVRTEKKLNRTVVGILSSVIAIMFVVIIGIVYKFNKDNEETVTKDQQEVVTEPKQPPVDSTDGEEMKRPIEHWPLSGSGNTNTHKRTQNQRVSTIESPKPNATAKVKTAIDNNMADHGARVIEEAREGSKKESGATSAQQAPSSKQTEREHGNPHRDAGGSQTTPKQSSEQATPAAAKKPTPTSTPPSPAKSETTTTNND